MSHSRTWLFLSVVLAAVMFAMSQFYRSSVAVISPDLMQEMGLNALDLSRISAAFFYAFALMQIPVGIFLDSVGAKTAMVGLTLVSVAGAVVFALGTTPGWLTFGRVLLGIGMACNFMGALKLLTLWFEPRQFATLSALVVSLGTIGNIAAATPLVLLVGWMGWRHSFLAIAGFTLALALVFLAVIKERPRAARDAPGRAGPGDRAGTQADAADARPSVSQTLGRAWDLFHHRDFWIISLATFCRYGIYAAVQGLWAGPFLIHALGLPPVTAGNILFLMSIGLIIGCPLCGWLSDFLVGSRKKIIIPGHLVHDRPAAGHEPAVSGHRGVGGLPGVLWLWPGIRLRPGHVCPYQGACAPGQCRAGHDRHQFFHHGRGGRVSPGHGPCDDPVFPGGILDPAGLSPGIHRVRGLSGRYCPAVRHDPGDPEKQILQPLNYRHGRQDRQPMNVRVRSTGL
jgi:MFS family permease